MREIISQIDTNAVSRWTFCIKDAIIFHDVRHNNRRLLGFVSVAVTNRILLSVIMRKGWIYNHARFRRIPSFVLQIGAPTTFVSRSSIIAPTYAGGNPDLIAALHKVHVWLATAKVLNHFCRSNDSLLFLIMLREIARLIRLWRNKYEILNCIWYLHKEEK